MRSNSIEYGYPVIKQTLKLLDRLCTGPEHQPTKCLCAIGLVPAYKVSPADSVVSFVCNAVFDLIVLGSNVGVVDVHGFDTCKYLDGFIVMAMG